MICTTILLHFCARLITRDDRKSNDVFNLQRQLQFIAAIYSSKQKVFRKMNAIYFLDWIFQILFDTTIPSFFNHIVYFVDWKVLIKSWNEINIIVKLYSKSKLYVNLTIF